MSRRFWITTLGGWILLALIGLIMWDTDRWATFLCIILACLCPFVSGPEAGERRGH